MYVGPHVKYPLFLSDFNETLNFADRYLKNQKPNFMKICPVGAKLFHTNGQTDTHLRRFRKIAKAP